MHISERVNWPDYLPLAKNEVIKYFSWDTKAFLVVSLSFFSLVIMHNEWATIFLQYISICHYYPPPLPWFSCVQKLTWFDVSVLPHLRTLFHYYKLLSAIYYRPRISHYPVSILLDSLKPIWPVSDSICKMVYPNSIIIIK